MMASSDGRGHLYDVGSVAIVEHDGIGTVPVEPGAAGLLYLGGESLRHADLQPAPFGRRDPEHPVAGADERARPCGDLEYLAGDGRAERDAGLLIAPLVLLHPAAGGIQFGARDVELVACLDHQLEGTRIPGRHRGREDPRPCRPVHPEPGRRPAILFQDDVEGPTRRSNTAARASIC